MEDLRKGKIVKFMGSWQSGLGQLMIADSETGAVELVPCENTATVRALEAAFGDVVTPAHTADGDGYQGKEVFWSMDEYGLMMLGFTPVDMADEEMIESYELGRQKCAQ